MAEPIDLSKFIESIAPYLNDDEPIPGLKDAGPITISGHWQRSDLHLCHLCGQMFSVGPEGLPILTTPVGDFIACGPCAISLL